MLTSRHRPDRGSLLPTLDAPAVSTGSIDRAASPISPPDSRAPFVAAARETSR